MEKEKLKKLFDEMFGSAGFKKKGGDWILESAELKKLVNLQRSSFGNYYYVNFGFLIKAVEAGNVWAHVMYRLASRDKEENQRIDDLLNLDSDINEQQRLAELRFHLSTNVIGLLQKIITEAELFSELENRRRLNGHLNDIPLSVKRRFGISIN